MDLLYIVTSYTFFIWCVRNIFYCIKIFQDNDYRFDRLFLHLKETAQGRNLLFSVLSLVKWLAILFFIVVIFQEKYLSYFHLSVFAIYAFQALLVVREIVLFRSSLPVFTTFTKFVTGAVFLCVVILYFVPLLDKYLWLLVIDRLIPLFVVLFVFLFSFPKEIAEDLHIQKAIKKIKSHKDLMVIGITGSYGKSSTKEFLYQILQSEYKVIRTKGRNNSLSEIADTILQKLRKNTQIFIAEIDAYGQNEIRKIAHILHPNIGILTGIDDQYLGLIGDRKKSAEIKSELIDSLPRHGLALFNGNDATVFELYKNAKKDKIMYTTEHVMTKDGLGGGKKITATNIVTDEKFVAFDVIFPNRKLSLKTQLLGEHTIENLLPAIFISDYFGMNDKAIQRAVRHVSPLPHMMQIRRSKKRVVYVDDTSSTNPTSVTAAIDYLKHYKKNKFIVFEPMLNLGKNANKIHEHLAGLVAQTASVILVTNNNYNKEIYKGIGKTKRECQIVRGSPSVLAKYIETHVKSGDVVLFEGREARHVLDKLS